MASIEEPLRRDPFANEPNRFSSIQPKALPILSTAPGTNPGDPMDISQPSSSSMGPPTSSPNGDRTGEQTPQPQSDHHHLQQHQHQHQHHQSNSSNGAGAPAPVGAAAAAQQPKVVQTAFIHKLYNMLEDQSIQHLISWSSSNESFVMSPSSEFSKVLAQYFKHTNISSFVRQLNMYGFHKVSDVFHTGSPDSPLWEFKHGNGNFKRGDLAGLREIKRRASRHALIHRDSFSGASKLPTQPPSGAPMGEAMQDTVENRVHLLEWNNHDVSARLSRMEDAYSSVTAKCQALLEGLQRCHQWNNELSSHVLTLVPDPENPVHREVTAMRQNIARHMDLLRSLEDAPPPDQIFTNKQPFLQNAGLPMEPSMPISPRQRPFDESRRPSFQGPLKPPATRGPVPSYLQGSPRRYGSIGTGNGNFSPSANRPTYPPPPPPPPPQAQPSQQQQHPLATMTSPPSNLPRRHTSADIRLQGWEGGPPPPPPQYNPGTSPYASGQSSSAWPSSPRAAANAGDQQIRDALAQYELPRVSHMGSRQPSPGPHDTGPPAFNNTFAPSYANTNDAGWQLPGARFPFKGLETPGPPTRRSSMASNVHSLLNPADTAERDGEDEGPDERKRKRLL